MRAVLTPPLEWIGERLAAAGVRPLALTGIGWLVGVGACAAVGARLWLLGLALWLANRLLDGLDGAVARVRAWVFAGMVLFTVGQRVRLAVTTLR